MVWHESHCAEAADGHAGLPSLVRCGAACWLIHGWDCPFGWLWRTPGPLPLYGNQCHHWTATACRKHKKIKKMNESVYCKEFISKYNILNQGLILGLDVWDLILITWWQMSAVSTIRLSLTAMCLVPVTYFPLLPIWLISVTKASYKL